MAPRHLLPLHPRRLPQPHHQREPRLGTTRWQANADVSCLSTGDVTALSLTSASIEQASCVARSSLPVSQVNIRPCLPRKLVAGLNRFVACSAMRISPNGCVRSAQAAPYPAPATLCASTPLSGTRITAPFHGRRVDRQADAQKCEDTRLTACRANRMFLFG